jgi:DNA-binding NtrC family response regulator
VPALARHFISRFAAEENKPVAGLTPEATDLIEKFQWPGNVRQLENTIFRAVVLCDATVLDVCDFPQIASALGVEVHARRTHMAPMMAPAPAYAPSSHAAAPVHHTSAHVSPYALAAMDGNGHMRKLEDIESEMIRLAISHYEGHMSEVARRLGIGRSTLYRKLKDLGLEQHIEESEEAKRAAG